MTTVSDAANKSLLFGFITDLKVKIYMAIFIHKGKLVNNRAIHKTYDRFASRCSNLSATHYATIVKVLAIILSRSRRTMWAKYPKNNLGTRKNNNKENGRSERVYARVVVKTSTAPLLCRLPQEYHAKWIACAWCTCSTILLFCSVVVSVAVVVYNRAEVSGFLTNPDWFWCLLHTKPESSQIRHES